MDLIGTDPDSTLAVGRGYGSGGVCLEAGTASSCGSFPSNGRYVLVAGGRVDEDTDGLPLLIPHEMGHALGLPHSHTIHSEYDNPMDVMSNATLHFGKTRVGTLAVNRYQAGWVDLGGVEVHGSGTITYPLLPAGMVRGRSLVPAGSLPEMLVVEGDEGVFVSLGARVAEGYDSELTATATGNAAVATGEEGVEAYLVDQRAGNCSTLSSDPYGACVSVHRGTTQIPPRMRISTDHVYEARGLNSRFETRGSQFTGTGIAGLGVRVVEREGDVWLVRVVEGGDVGPFGDIGSYGDRYRIELMKWLEITKGCRDGKVFCPNRVVNRLELAVFVVRALGEDQVPKLAGSKATFVDVPKSLWAWGYVERFHKLGITDGCGRSTPTKKYFCPSKDVTKAQVAVFLVRAMGETPPATTRRTFADVPTGHFAHRYIEKLYDLGLAPHTTIGGKKYYSPASTIRRHLMARWLTDAAVTLQGVPYDLRIKGDPPGLPPNVVVSHPWAVRWDAPEAAGTGGVSGYDISYGVVGGNGRIASTGTLRSADLSYLVATNRGQQLYVRVRAYNDHGASAWTTAKTFTAPPVTILVPPAPINAAAVSETPGKVTLTWKPPTNTPTADSATDTQTPNPAAVSGYRILRKPAGGQNNYQIIVSNTASADTTYTDTNVPPGQHTYQIYAINNSGLISAQGSNPATVTVKPQPTTTTTTSTTTTTTTAATGLTLSIADASATEGGTLEFTVTLSQEPYQFITVNYDTHDDTATHTSDYYRATGTLILNPLQTTTTLKVHTRNDNTTENTETFQLVLTQPRGATLATGTATGTIHDND